MAQYSKNRSQGRSLGSTRASNDVSNGRLPPVYSSITEGMIVSPMTVPPQKVTVNSGRKNIIDSTDKKAEDLERLLKEKSRILYEKEKELKSKAALVKTKDQQMSNLMSEKMSLQEKLALVELECKQLTNSISKKEQDIKELNEYVNAKKNETDYKSLYESEKINHEETKSNLSKVEASLKESKEMLLKMERQHAEELSSLTAKLEHKHQQDLQEKDQQLQEKEDRIQKMKKQMADAFTGNSMERQQQIDELSKELTKVQGECENLRQKLRQSGSKNPSASCESCKNLKAHLEKKEQIIKERNRTIDELNIVCGRYELQLKQQEELLKQWQDVKGRVLIFEK